MLPFGVFPTVRSHSPRRYQPRVRLPPQRFTRSRGFAPPTVCRPCFMPVPPVGFSPSRSIPPAERRTLSSTPSLMWLSQRRVPPAPPAAAGRLGAICHGCGVRWPKATSQPALHFRALIPASVRTRRRRLRPTDGPRPSWGCSSLGGSLSPTEAFPGAYPLSSFTTVAQAKTAAAPQSLTVEEHGWTPSSLPPLPRSLHLVVEPSSTQRD